VSSQSKSRAVTRATRASDGGDVSARDGISGTGATG
jgi:hypothetical protein